MWRRKLSRGVTSTTMWFPFDQLRPVLVSSDLNTICRETHEARIEEWCESAKEGYLSPVRVIQKLIPSLQAPRGPLPIPVERFSIGASAVALNNEIASPPRWSQECALHQRLFVEDHFAIRWLNLRQNRARSSVPLSAIQKFIPSLHTPNGAVDEAVVTANWPRGVKSDALNNDTLCASTLVTSMRSPSNAI